MAKPQLADNTPWWLPDVTVAGAGAGVIVERCGMYSRGDSGPKHLEGGYYPASQVGEQVWFCKARQDVRVRASCRCGHRGDPIGICNGHYAMWRKRGTGVCPACVHPPAERLIQEKMRRVQIAGSMAIDVARSAAAAQLAIDRAESVLWGLQAELDELVERGIVHRCGLTLEEVS